MSKRARADRDRTRVEPLGAAQPPRSEVGHGAIPDASSIAATDPVVGTVAGEAVRGGEDVRRRGWFWHWNSIVTQYAPLIGLKGVGLLNSYTVWTDRREESPHRGYAFPSQQSEADFYGEDRAELITINKILVALDLIEIRKEMVLRADEQGRRWRVPHNFYRVKDHDDGFSLTGEAVLRVVELADRDKTVYRFIRRIFSPRFSPIDGDNIWHRMLPELRQTEVWQRLAARAEHEDNRASARTRAGHAARKAGLGAPDAGDTATPTTIGNDSAGVTTGKAKATSVATTNKGFHPDVAPINDGLTAESTTLVAPANRGEPTAVAPTNRTYNQSDLTTMTTTGGPENEDLAHPVPSGPDTAPSLARAVTPRALHPAPETMTSQAAGPGGGPAPVDVVGAAAAVRAFEEANGRGSSIAERKLLRGMAERFDPAARAQARSGCDTGWAWLAAAVYEAVEAGSAYVAPRRLREIVSRWEREGAPGGEIRTPREHGATTETAAAQSGSAPGELVPLGEGPDLALPHGFGSRRTWEFAVGLLSTALGRARLAELVGGTWIAGYQDGEVTLAAPDPIQAERLAGEYSALVTRKLSEAMRRPVRLAVLTAEIPATAGAQPPEPSPVERPPESADDHLLPSSFIVAECGLPSGQVWAAVLDEALQSGEFSISRANFDAWLRSTSLLGRGEQGELIVGAPHTLAQRRIASRFLPVLRAAAEAVIGAPLPVEVVVERDWLHGRPRRAERRDPAANERRPA